MFIIDLEKLIYQTYKLDFDDLKRKNRSIAVAQARHATLYSLSCAGYSLCSIGKYFNRTHATGLNSIKQANNLMFIKHPVTDYTKLVFVIGMAKELAEANGDEFKPYRRTNHKTVFISKSKRLC